MKAKKEITLNKATKVVIDSLIDKVLSNEDFSWERTWDNIATGNSPYNPISKSVYSGFNSFILGLYATVKGINQFCTVKQAEKQDGKLSFDGDKKEYMKNAIPLLHFQWIYFDPKTGKKYYNKKDIADLSDDVKERIKKYPKTSYFTVFSINDFVGLPTYETPKPKRVNKPIEVAQKIVDTYKNECQINIGLDNSKAYYSPMQDIINLPDFNAFKSAQDFYHVAFHEIAHSTGHQNRLKRDLAGMFGNDKYAKEELIAEFSATLVGARLDILTKDIKNNVTAYLKGWSKRMQNKENELYLALTQANKAYDYIMKVTNI